MFGHLPLIVKELVLSHGGLDRWESILKRLGLTNDFNETQIYEERLGEELINETPTFLNMRKEVFMELLGETYLSTMMAKGNSQMVRLLGGSFYEFIQNLDFMHTVSMAKYPKADIPLFKMEENASSMNRIRLHYYSRREYLSRMVESLLRCVGRSVFRKDIDIQVVSETRDDDRYHVIYSVLVDELQSDSGAAPTMVAQTKKHGENQLREKDVEREKEKLEHLKMEFGEDALPVSRFRQQKAKVKSCAKMNPLYNNNPPRYPSSLCLTGQDFCDIFPYHVVFDSNMSVKQAGVQIQFIIPELREENETITKYLELVHPGKAEFSFHNVQKYICCPHVVKTKRNNLTNDYTQKGSVVYLRGQMIELSNKHQILYLCSPYVHSLDVVEHFGMHISDIPTHDVTKYMFQGCQSTEMFRNRTVKGDYLEGFLGLNGQPVFSDELDHTGAEHKFKMVPRGIADLLKSGHKVEGKIYRNCTILFCDIVQFGIIVEKCTPTEVLTLINSLHEHFDRLAMGHDVYKVDVIGDAYVIVSGIPHPVKNHAERICKMGLSMIQVCKMETCPYNYGQNIGNRVLARIGVHTGDVIGGVIGRPVHRFTIMGENVVLASRMESHGVPDKVHLTEATYYELKPYKLETESRGNIDIRGSGRQFTYLLKDNPNVVKDMMVGFDQGGLSSAGRGEIRAPVMSPHEDIDHTDRPGRSHNKPHKGHQPTGHMPRHKRPKSGKRM